MTLTHQEEQRLRDELRLSDGVDDANLTFDVEFEGSVYSYDASIWWAEEDHDPQYPEIALGWSSRGNERPEDQPANQIVEINEKPNEPTIDIVLGRRVYDDLEISCTVDGGINDDGVPAKVRSNALARYIARFFEYDFDQNYEGASGERPVLARVNSGPVYASGMIDKARVEKYEIVIRLFYTDTYTRTVDSIDDVSGDVSLGEGSNSWSTT